LITIKEMAQIIGVSPTTVSNVIRGKTKEVSPELAKKIQKVVEEHNYVPNRSAINLAKNNSNVIGFVMSTKSVLYNNMVQDFFTGELIGALEIGVRKHGYFLMIYSSDDMEEIRSFVSSWNIDGIVALGFSYEKAQILKDVYKKPLVFIDGYFLNDQHQYTNVGIEDYQGAFDMTSYLIKEGHQKFAFFSDNYTGGDYARYMGFLDAIKAGGLPADSGYKYKVERRLDAIKKSVTDAVSEHPEATALVFCSDNYAVAAMGTLSDLGYNIPKDISVVGYDDAIVASFVRPKLTTVRQSTGDKADIAINKLIKMIKNTSEKPEKIILPVTLQIRDSVKKIEA